MVNRIAGRLERLGGGSYALTVPRHVFDRAPTRVVPKPPVRIRSSETAVPSDPRRWKDEQLWRDDRWVGPKHLELFLRATWVEQVTWLAGLWLMIGLVLGSSLPWVLAAALAFPPAALVTAVLAYGTFARSFRRGSDGA